MGLKSNKVIKAGLGYTIGNYFLRGLGFITVPIFARILTEEDFGIYNNFMAYEGIIYLLICLALHTCIKNAKYQYGDEKLDEFTSSVAIIPLIVFCVMFVLINIFPAPFENFLSMDLFQIDLLLAYCYGLGMLMYYQNRLALDYVYKEYLYISYFNTISSVALSLVFVLTCFSGQRYMGRIMGSVIPMIIILVYILIRLFKKCKPKIVGAYWKFALKISLPIIPHGIGQVILLSVDRIMINRYIGAREAGLYSFAYTIYTIVQVTSNSLSTAFEPWVFNKMSENKRADVQKRSTQFFWLLCVISLLVILIAPELIYILGSEKYKASIYCAIPILIGGAFTMTYVIPSELTYYYEKTQLIAVGTVGAAVFDVVLNYVFINKFGYVAAAYTTLVCSALYFVFHCIISYKVSGMLTIPIKHMILGFVCVMAAGAATELLMEQSIIRILISVVIVLISGVVLLKQYRIYKGEKHES